MWACRVAVWGFDLGEEDGYDLVAEHYNPRCEPPWSERELRKKCHDASDPNFKHPRGWLLHTERDRSPLARDPSRPVPTFGPMFDPPPADAPLAPSDPLAEPVAPPPAAPAAAGQGGNLPGVELTDPYHLARSFIAAQHMGHNDGLTLRFWGGRYARWKEGAYDRVEEVMLRAALSDWIEWEFARVHVKELEQHLRNQTRGATEKPPPRKHRVTRALVLDVMQAVHASCRLPEHCCPPCWIDSGPPAAELVACRNGLVHVPAYLAGRAGAFVPATPRFLTCARVKFDFDPKAPEPREWLNFLADIWENDPASVACLQEWFGYLLTPDTSLHKMLMIVGPPRAGKGTIGRVLQALIGKENCAAPTLGKLGDRFALAQLLDKTVGIFADAHLSGRADAVQITEELLGISGEDARTVDLKFRDPITTTFQTRFVFFSNELPAFSDASGAIVSRFVFLRLTKSFVGREDTGLIDRLLRELPGILLWSLAGWKRLREQGHFTAPASAEEMREDAEAMASPVSAWASECCELVADEWSETEELYESWQMWCERQGRDRPGTKVHFVRQLRAAIPSLRKCRPGGATMKRLEGYRGIRLLSAFESGQIPV